MVHYQDQDSVLKLSFQFDDGIDCEKSYETDEESVEHIVQNPETLFDIVGTSTYISLLCPSNSLEIFFVAEVLDKSKPPCKYYRQQWSCHFGWRTIPRGSLSWERRREK